MGLKTLVRAAACGSLIAIAAALTACGTQTDSSTGSGLTGGGPALTQSLYNVKITSFDGTQIAATVFVPNAPANTPVPLIVHSHSWGSYRMHALTPRNILEKAFYMPTEAAVKLANDNGYFAISFDERGWGESGGTDELMSPAYEGKDFQAVVDWAEQNLSPQLAKRNGKTVVGTLGYSYGAGFQLLGASLDDRVAVMVPALAWHSFIHGLGPGLPLPQPRSAWSNILIFSAQLMGAQTNPILIPDMQSAVSTGIAPQALIDLGTPNGPNAYCDAGGTPAPGQSVPKIPAFLVQGWQDALLPSNEAVANAACLRATGADVRLLIQQYGHTLPGQFKIPKGDGIIGVAMQSQINCGNQSFALADAMYSFIDEHIRGPAASGPHVNVPNTCLTLDDTTGIVVDAVPVGNTSFAIGTQTVSDSTFVPLHTATAAEVLAGIPHLSVSIATDSSVAPYAYFGIGILRAGQSAATLLDDQQLPINGSGDFDADMPGIATTLNSGDAIGILATNSSTQYSYDTPASQSPAAYTFSGTLLLPYVK